MKWTPKTVVMFAVVMVVLAIGGTLGTVFLLEVIRQPEIFVTDHELRLLSCSGGFPPRTRQIVDATFVFANTGDVPGYVEVEILADGLVVGNYTYLVLPHSSESSQEFLELTGCRATEVDYRVARVWRAYGH